jgi:hypothetical protein
LSWKEFWISFNINPSLQKWWNEEPNISAIFLVSKLLVVHQEIQAPIL